MDVHHEYQASALLFTLSHIQQIDIGEATPFAARY